MLFVSLLFLCSCDIENPGTVLTANELPGSVVTFISEKKILGDEEINNNLIIVKYLREDVEQTNVSLKELIELYNQICYNIK